MAFFLFYLIGPMIAEIAIIMPPIAYYLPGFIFMALGLQRLQSLDHDIGRAPYARNTL